MSRSFWMLVSAALATAACDSKPPDEPPMDAGEPDGSVPPPPPDVMQPPPPTDVVHPAAYFCELPGSLRFEASGTTMVPGGQTTTVPPSLSFLKLPTNFCVHQFGKVGNPRQLRFAPGGELFVASPTGVTTGGGSGGLAGIVYLPDDNRDGYADSISIFQLGLAQTQGLLFTKTHFYYQDNTKIMRLAYQAGDRFPRAPSELVADIKYPGSMLHWPKPMDEADDGTIYVGNGGDQGEICDPASRPIRGGIVRLDGSPGGLPVVKGFRNPIALRCQRGHNKCFAVELAKDYSADEGGREKLVLIREGDDWGYPCCATKDVAHMEVKTADCSQVVPEDVSFLIGDTPFGVDFEPGKWPAPYKGNAFVPLHGTAGPWLGARLVSVAVNLDTGDPLPSTTLGGVRGGMRDFATGWDDKSTMHGRPAAVEFAADGRLFLANDNTGDIIWIAPFELER